jgi:hypothetical protein
MAELLNARAFTYGHSIAFGASAYSPATVHGRRLIAHELAHVIQQRRGGAVSDADTDVSAERGAAEVADRIAHSTGPVRVTGSSGRRIAREPLTGDLALVLSSDVDASKLTPEARRNYLLYIDKRIDYLKEHSSTPSPDFGIGFGTSPEVEVARLTEWRRKLVEGSGTLVAPDIQRATPKPTLASVAPPSPQKAPVPASAKPSAKEPRGASVDIVLIGTPMWSEQVLAGVLASFKGDEALRADLNELKNQLSGAEGKLAFAGGLSAGITAGALASIADLLYGPLKLYLDAGLATDFGLDRARVDAMYKEIADAVTGIIPRLAALASTDPSDLGHLIGAAGSAYIRKGLLLEGGRPSSKQKLLTALANPAGLSGLANVRLPELSALASDLLSVGSPEEAQKHVYNKGVAIGQAAGAVIINAVLLFVAPEALVGGAAEVVEAIRSSRIVGRLFEVLEGIPKLKTVRNLSRATGATMRGVAEAAPVLGTGVSSTYFGDTVMVGAARDIAAARPPPGATSSIGDLPKVPGAQGGLFYTYKPSEIVGAPKSAAAGHLPAPSAGEGSAAGGRAPAKALAPEGAPARAPNPALGMPDTRVASTPAPQPGLELDKSSRPLGSGETPALHERSAETKGADVDAPLPSRAKAPTELVWVNTDSNVYHYGDSPYFGTTKSGRFMPESEALKNPAYRPAQPRGKRDVSTYTRISQEAGRLQEKVVSSITGWPKNTQAHSTSFGDRIPDFLPAKDPSTNAWITASRPEDALFVADSKYYDEKLIGASDQIKGFIELATKTNPPQGGVKTLILFTNESARISPEVSAWASSKGVTVRQIFQMRSK